MTSEILTSVENLCARLKEPAGAILISEEALTEETTRLLGNCLADQGPWSDIPVVFIINRNPRSTRTHPFAEMLIGTANVSLLERPFGVMTLILMVQVALKARQKQYQIRNLIKAKDEALGKRDEFLNIVSHELKTPITALRLQVQLRKRAITKNNPWAFEPAQVRSLVDLSDKQVERLTRLVDEMLDLSRIDSGKLALSKSEGELGQIVKEVVEFMKLQYASSEVPLRIDATESVFGQWDHDRLEQVIINLLTNALKYGENTPVTVSVYREDSFGYVTVADQGPGISEENKKKIFQRYERGSATSSVSGLGLGLYISKQIIELHHGQIIIDSAPGAGAKFILKLPLN